MPAQAQLSHGARCIRATSAVAARAAPRGSNVAVDEGRDLGLRQGADLGLGHDAVLEQDQCRDAPHAELGRGRGVLVDVDLSDLQALAVVTRHLVEQRRNHLARAAPLRPEVDKDGLVRLEDVLFERSIGDMLDLFAHYRVTSKGSRVRPRDGTPICPIFKNPPRGTDPLRGGSREARRRDSRARSQAIQPLS
ncbi:hypothetical protein DFQ30_001712 [Apophysomyces sp. BC1015]|nr:hypothetical protein DFQ30_001712 [Apophysomyces sp. BC1015]